MIEINKLKLERQLETITKWEKVDYIGIAEYYPGTGKTFLGILAIQHIDKIEKTNYIISTPNDVILKQWRGYIDKLPVNLQHRIILKTKNQLLTENILYKEVGLLIIDEIHEYSTELSERLLNKSIIHHKRFLGLTGTTNHVNFRNILKFYKIFDIVSEYEAKSKGFVAEMIEYNLAVPMTAKEAEIYKNYTDAISKNMPLFNNNLTIATLIVYGGKHPTTRVPYQGSQYALSIATSKGWHNKLDLNIPAHKELDRLYNPSSIISTANFLLQIVNRRKKLLSNIKGKEDAVIKLLKKFTNTKTIIFSESTTFTESIYRKLNENKIPTVIFHSKLKSVMKPGKTGKLIKFGTVRLKREAIDALKNGTATALATTKALDKGLDIPDLRFSIITSGTTSIDQEIQRKSRAGRKENNSDDPVLNVNLYVKDTQDELWLRRRQENNTNSPIFVDNIEDISYKPQPNYFNYEDL